MVNTVDVMTPPLVGGVETKQVLHIGCSVLTPVKLHRSFAGWREIRLDSDPAVNPNIVGSMAQMSKVATGSMDGVYAWRSLQQLHAFEIPPALLEIRRVLKPDAYALIGFLDLGKLAPYLTGDRFDETIYDAPFGPVTVLDLLYGPRPLIAQGKTMLANHVGFTPKSIGALFVKAGFSEVQVQPSGFDVWVHAVKGTTPAISFNLLDPASVGGGEPTP